MNSTPSTKKSINLPRPCQSVFDSSSKLSKKHDSLHERLSMGMTPQTPSTPMSCRSKFVLPSNLSPFPYSPKQNQSNPKLSTSIQGSATPLRKGVSSEQLVFDFETSDKFNKSPSRLLFDRSQSPGSSQFDLSSEVGSEFDLLVGEFDEFGSCEISPDLLRPVMWRNPVTHFLDEPFFAKTNDDFEYTDVEDFTCSNDMLSDFFNDNYEVVEVCGEGSFSTVYKVNSKKTNKNSALKLTRKPFSGVTDRRRRLKEVNHLWRLKGGPHCIQILSAWEQNGYLYIETELCENGRYLDIYFFFF